MIKRKQNLTIRKVTFGKSWITLKEFFRFSTIVMWIFNAYDYKSPTKVFYTRIIELWKRSGSNFTFLYLKECLRLCTKYLSGSPDNSHPSNKIRVKRDSFGLPSIIPKELRVLLHSKENRAVQFLLTLLTIFRVFPTVQKWNLATIVGEFTGTSRSFDLKVIRSALKDLGVNAIKLPTIKLIKLESASPLGRHSTWASNSDLVALLHHPSKLWHTVLSLGGSLKGLFLIAWLVCLWIIAVPFALLSWLVSGRLYLGRLSVVRDQAGKGRIVAMTNYWIQVALYPLHSAIFDILKRLRDQDGTFDQRRPLIKLISSNSDQKFSCFDLSAATDRLPLQIQVDILNLLSKGLGDRWGKLLDIEWYFNKKLVKYEVGQPMGAYSSWGMLALTHHTIVKIAAMKSGIISFKDYAILGDDIVIRNDVVADEYLNLMKSLGVSINLSKSLISKDFAEFAKVLLGPSINYTPLGAGLILQTVRNKVYVGALCAEAYRIGISYSFSTFLGILQNLKGYANQSYVGLWSTIGLNGALFRGISAVDASYLKKTIAAMWSFATSESIMARYCLFNALLQYNKDKLSDSFNKLNRELDYMNSYFLKSEVKSRSLIPYDIIVKVISPAFWITWLSFLRDVISYIDLYAKLHWSQWSGSWDDIFWLSKETSLSITSIHWADSKSVKLSAEACKTIRFYALSIRFLSEECLIGEQDTFVLEPGIKFFIDKNKGKLKEYGLNPSRMSSAFVPKKLGLRY